MTGRPLGPVGAPPGAPGPPGAGAPPWRAAGTCSAGAGAPEGWPVGRAMPSPGGVGAAAGGAGVPAAAAAGRTPCWPGCGAPSGRRGGGGGGGVGRLPGCGRVLMRCSSPSPDEAAGRDEIEPLDGWAATGRSSTRGSAAGEGVEVGEGVDPAAGATGSDVAGATGAAGSAVGRASLAAGAIGSGEVGSSADVGAAAFLAAAFFAVFLTGSGSSGCWSRRRPSASALRRTRSACASSMLDEWLFTPMPSAMQRSRHSLFVSPSSRASS